MEKTLNKSFIMMESFTMFAKRIENCIDVAKAAGVLYTDTQITNKVFSIMLKVRVFMIECDSGGNNLILTKHSLLLNDF